MKHYPVSTTSKLKGLYLFLVLGAVSFDASASEQNAKEMREARAWYSSFAESQCRTLDEIDALFVSEDTQYPIRHAIAATDYKGELKPGNDRTVIFQFFCDAGAYNSRHIFVSYDDGLFRQLAFSQPAISVAYENDSPDSAVKSVSIDGFEARLTVTNPAFDVETGSLKETTFWRGIGDAANESWWRFKGDRFVLSRFRVDASYDGEINPSHDLYWPAKQK
ncbi:MAG: DUF1176 domain-containing protein [Rhizobiaceae bacterium]